MQEASVSDFINFKNQPILQRSRLFYVCRIGGFLLSTVGGLGFMSWGMATGRMENAFVGMLLMVLASLPMFILSYRASAFCKECRVQLETFYCVEQQKDGQHSGNIFVCRKCNAYDVRLNLDD